MNENWKDPKIIIGNAATGSEFYKRDDIIEEIWDELKKGNSVLLAAPRRVGKTSVMQYIKDESTENYKLIFSDIEGINSTNELYERIYTLLVNCLNISGKAKKWFAKFLKSKSITEITIKGIKFENKPTDFLMEIEALLEEINEKDSENIILLLDELPKVLFEINKKSNTDAISILTKLRHWRQQPEMNKKVKFVFAGSVGIHYVVKQIETRNSDLNDLATINFNPLSENEAYGYIVWATTGATVTYTTKLKQHLLNKIRYFVPYFINLMLDEINRQARKANNPKITTHDIDIAFDKVVKNNDSFDDWKMRLQTYMPYADFNFVNEILTHIAHKEQIILQEVYDKAIKYKQTADYMDFIHDLEKDGYIVEVDGKYLFISPFLSAFWKRNNPIYNA
jgi:glutathione peroxidase-family protein